MNTELLLTNIERLIDTAEAVDQIRRLVLELAIRGKLVPQDPSDNPASELLKGDNKSGVSTSESPQEIDPTLPQGWECTRLGAVANIIMGQSPPGETYNKAGEGVALINGPVEFSDGPFGLTVINQYTTAPTKFCEKGDLLVCVRGSTTGRTNIAGFRACIGRGVAAIQAHFDDAYVRLFIWKSREEIIAMGRGVAFPSISRKQIEDIALPLPPLAEQQRIVAKVDELMAMCDRLETQRAEREKTRDRLTAASFDRLSDPDPETFQNDTRLVLDALPALTASPDQIKALRQTILDLAVQGKLVPQDPSDEPASLLLKRVEGAKGRTKRGQGSIDHECAPYHNPAGWVWTSLDQLVVWGPRNGVSPIPTVRQDAPKAITLTATTSGSFNPAHFKHVEANIDANSDYWLEDGDLLFQRGNTREYVGMAAIFEGPPRTYLFPDLMMKVRVSGEVSLRFVHLVAISPPARTYFSSNATGAQASMPKINQAILVSMPVPLPPLAEQERIIAKVDELMLLCDALEASLSDGAATRSRLLDALIAEMLAPAQPYDATTATDREEALLLRSFAGSS